MSTKYEQERLAYENRERDALLKQLREVEKADLATRKAGRASFADAVRECPEVVAERVGWILNGSYGYGAMVAAQSVALAVRGNREASLSQMVAALDHACSGVMAREVWKALSVDKQQAFDALVSAEIDLWKENREEELDRQRVKVLPAWTANSGAYLPDPGPVSQFE